MFFVWSKLHLFIFYLLAVVPGATSQFDNGSPVTIDQVRQVILREIWNEPLEYKGSGSNMPSEWRIRFHGEVFDDARNAETDKSMRKKLLDHVSYRSSVLLNSLSDETIWTAHNITFQELKNLRVIKDESWNEEFPSICLTVQAVVQQLQQERSLIADSSGFSLPLSTQLSHMERLRWLWRTKSEWRRAIIVVGELSMKGEMEMTILDGNHRAIALLAESEVALGKHVSLDAVAETLQSPELNPTPSTPFLNPESGHVGNNCASPNILAFVGSRFVRETPSDHAVSMPPWKFFRQCEQHLVDGGE
jgi:hypothetical protein